MNKAQAATCAKCSRCGVLWNNYFLVMGVCIYCVKEKK